MDQLTLDKIRNVLIVAEQGTQVMAYGAVYIFNDGPGNKKQVTLSIGFTQFGGNLGKVLDAYTKAQGKVTGLTPYNSRMGENGLYADARFINLLKEAGKDPVMQNVQNTVFDTVYLQRAVDWGNNEGFTLPLSFLVISDSFLHSGSILQFIRNRFPEKTPKNGGDEKKWISQYTQARQDWLGSHSNRLLRNTVYRTKYYLTLITDNDWQLDNYYLVAMNGVKPLNVTTGEGDTRLA